MNTIQIGINNAQVERILAASRGLPSWKACIAEGTSWEGTTDENITRYREIMSI